MRQNEDGFLDKGSASAVSLTKRRLPLCDVADDDRFVEVRAKEASIAHAIERLDLNALRKSRRLSANAKTGVSLDFPVGHTCRPTALCSRVCYAAAPSAPARWPKSLAHRLRNLRYFCTETTGAAVERLTKEFRQAQRRFKRATLDYLRVNGTGDLFPELVPVINGFAARNTDVKVWVVTRQFDLARGIAVRPNVFIQLSLDASTPAAGEMAARQLVALHPRAYLSFC